MAAGMHPSEEDEQSASAGVQSIETGLQLLTALALPGAPHMLKTIAEAAGMPASKAHRYVVSFGRMGFVERDPASGRYRLGPAALHIGLAALNGLDIVRLGSAAVTSLRDEIDETVALAIWTLNGPTFVRLEEASRPITVNVKTGSI
ncbi:MAG: helix-turn-helix domain-containing protein, partial [Pseudomonadota bacterium]|nr:helix-turn-helix domain-containing protein [Pseudomonadota bacterium]